MKKINIAIKNKTKLTSTLQKEFDVTYETKQNLFQRIFSKNSFFPDLFFFQLPFNKDSLNNIQNSKKIIVNCNGIKNKIMEKYPGVDYKKIEVLYPYITNKLEYDDAIKKRYREKYNLKDEEKIIFFTATDLQANGIQNLFKIASSLEEKNFKVLIESSKKQIDHTKLILNRLKVKFQVILIEDHPNKDELFIFSDIFIVPTKKLSLNSNILKAIYFRNVVFIPQNNYTSEIIDPFSIMQGVDDPSISFKIDALLLNENELVQIQKINQEHSLNFDFNSRYEIVKSIISKL